MNFAELGGYQVLPDEIDSLRIIPDEDLVTLITCTPYDINSHRLLVTGHRVSMDLVEASVLEESGGEIAW